MRSWWASTRRVVDVMLYCSLSILDALSSGHKWNQRVCVCVYVGGECVSEDVCSYRERGAARFNFHPKLLLELSSLCHISGLVPRPRPLWGERSGDYGVIPWFCRVSRHECAFMQSSSQPTTLCRAGNERKIRRALVFAFSYDVVIHCQDNDVKQLCYWVAWKQEFWLNTIKESPHTHHQTIPLNVTEGGVLGRDYHNSSTFPP